MKNAFRGLSFRTEWSRLITRMNSADGFLMVGGIVSIGFVWVAEDTMVRFVSLMAAIGCIVMFAASMQSKRWKLRRGFRTSDESTMTPDQAETGGSPLLSQEEGNEMKRLVFDDFEPHRQLTSGVQGIPTQEVDSSEPSYRKQHDVVPVFGENSRTPVPPVKRVSTMQKGGASRQFQLSDFFDVDSEHFRQSPEEGNTPELRNEFDFLLNKILAVIKDVVFANTVAFFWANRDKQQMICEARVTDSMSFLSAQRFGFGQDLVSQIALAGKPELITHMNPSSEKELLRYYEQVEFVKSFVGVPVFYPTQKNAQSPSAPVGVIVADSTLEDAFGQETIALMGQFTKLVSALIKTSTDKYDLLLDVELLNSIRRLQERIRNDFSTQTIAQILAEEAGKLLNWNFLSIVFYDDVKRGWATKKVVNRVQESYVAPEQLVDAEESIVGQTIKKNVHHVVHNLEENQLPRYYLGEKLVSAGSFVTVPISSLNKCYGALNVESRDRYNFSRKDVEILYRLAENAAAALEILYLNEMIKEYVIVDGPTNAYAKKFFVKKLQEELGRADDYGTELSLVLLSIDHSSKMIDRYGQEEFEAILADVVKILKAGTRSYDAVGRYDFNRFGVILINTTANDAYVWAEKMRKTIASHVVTINGKSSSVTSSIGVCGALEGMKVEHIIDHATTVLHKGMESGGNTVRVY